MQKSVSVELLPATGFVYRLWDAADRCIYVGHSKNHPTTRIERHRHQPWWIDVARADYDEVPLADLRREEARQITVLNPRENLRLDIGGNAGTESNRSIRVTDELWGTFGKVVQREPSPAKRNRAAVLRTFIKLYLDYPGYMADLLHDLEEIKEIRAYLGLDIEQRITKSDFTAWKKETTAT